MQYTNSSIYIYTADTGSQYLKVLACPAYFTHCPYCHVTNVKFGTKFYIRCIRPSRLSVHEQYDGVTKSFVVETPPTDQMFINENKTFQGILSHSHDGDLCFQHKLAVFATDGSKIEEQSVDYLIVSLAERYDFYIETKPESEVPETRSYFIRAETLNGVNQVRGLVNKFVASYRSSTATYEATNIMATYIN